jgi:hypothetical protein
MHFKRCFTATALLLVALLLGACASGFTKVSPTPPNNYQSLGLTTGKACGSLGIVATAYYAIPMGLNSRVENAYIDALNKVPGATSLTNVTMQEDWFWWLIGTARCVTVSGEAIK